MRFSIHSLPVRLSVWICLILLVCLSVTATVTGIYLFRRLTNRLNDQGITTAAETAYALDRIFVQAEQAAKLLAATLEQNPPPPEKQAAMLREAVRAMNSGCPELTGIGVAYLENKSAAGKGAPLFIEYEAGGEYHSLRIPNGIHLTQDWFVVPLALEKPVWTVPFRSNIPPHAMTFSYSVPLFREEEGERRPVGVLQVGIELDQLEKFLDNTALTDLRKLSRHGEIFVMNQFGHIMLYPNRGELLSESIFSLCDEASNPDPADRKAAQTLFRNHAGKITLNAVPRLMGESELLHAGCVNGWVVGIVIPQDWEMQILLPIFHRFLLGTAFVLCIVILVIFVVCRKLNEPLIQLSRVSREIGQGNFNAPVPDFRRDDEIGDLANSFRQMQSALADYIEQLKITVAARERSEGELNAAKVIQKDILPHILPPLPDCPTLVCAADLLPARGVGGDLFDIFPLDKDHWALIIGDVSGKGIPAALFMAVTQTLQRSIAHTLHAPGEIVSRLNRMLAKDNTTDMFVTYWLGILNIRTGTLDFTNGGHNPPLVRRADGTTEFLPQRHGPMLGVVPAKEYKNDTITLNPGDMLILYTDGVTESFNAAGKMFGNEGLVDTVKEHSAATPPEMLQHIQNAVFQFATGVEQADDITLLLIEFAKEKTGAELTVPAQPEQLETVMEFFDRYPAVAKLSAKEANLVRVCLEEVFVNIAMYAYPGSSGEATIRIWEENNQLRIRFTDSGIPFNPLDHPEPDLNLPVEERPIGGLGIHIIRQKMDYRDYRYENNQNILTIGKLITPGA